MSAPQLSRPFDADRNVGYADLGFGPCSINHSDKQPQVMLGKHMLLCGVSKRAALPLCGYVF